MSIFKSETSNWFPSNYFYIMRMKYFRLTGKEVEFIFQWPFDDWNWLELRKFCMLKNREMLGLARDMFYRWGLSQIQNSSKPKSKIQKTPKNLKTTFQTRKSSPIKVKTNWQFLILLLPKTNENLDEKVIIINNILKSKKILPR